MATSLEREKKEDNRLLAALGVVTLLVLLCVFVFDTDMKEYAHRAGLVANIFGVLFIVGSWVFLYFGAKNYSDAKGAGGWLILLALGVLLSCGFNFGDFGTSQQDKVDNGGDTRIPAEDMLKK